VLASHSLVTLLTTKWDLLKDSAQSEALVAGLEKRFRDDFASRLKDVTCFRVAARPDADDEPLGLDTLLARWFALPNPLPVQTYRESPPVRAFDRYATVIGPSGRLKGAS
jgi:hypothetical protein